MKTMANEATSSLSLQLREQIVGVLEKHLAANKGSFVFLFGSRAAGRFSERSDYDLGIMFFEPSGNKTSVLNDSNSLKPVPLDLLSRMKGDLEDLPILQRIELVDFSRVSGEFRLIALEGIVPIYEN